MIVSKCRSSKANNFAQCFAAYKSWLLIQVLVAVLRKGIHRASIKPKLLPYLKHTSQGIQGQLVFLCLVNAE